MLIEIRSDQFRKKIIPFGPGLNVVLGDDNASNSIGKSSLLMVVDFAFGGSALLDYNTDIVIELGHHDYFFSFRFDEEIYRFRRGTYQPNVVFRCNDDFEAQASLPLDEYTAFLKAAYGIAIEDITFRALVGLYSRVWGKDNLNVHKPLHVVQEQSAKECVTNLIKTFDRFGSIKSLARDLREKEEEKNALSTAFRKRIIPKIGKREHDANEARISAIQGEIDDIKANLARYATNIAEVVNREVLELKEQKDKLLEIKLRLESKLGRIQRNMAENRHIKSRHFDALLRYFPEVNKERLVGVEEFHSSLARLLRAELRESERDLKEQLLRVDEEIVTIDSRMAGTLSSVEQPSLVIDRVYELSTTLHKAREENEYFESDIALRDSSKELGRRLSEEKGNVLGLIQNTLNDTLRRIVTSVLGQERKSPTLTLAENKYSYEVFEDTGTGTAYASLIFFDLAIFQTTVLPCLSHDSILFKNIENDSVSRLVKLYLGIAKQSFIAIDEIDKYGTETAALLRKRAAVQLTNSEVLYIKDWRK